MDEMFFFTLKVPKYCLFFPHNQIVSSSPEYARAAASFVRRRFRDYYAQHNTGGGGGGGGHAWGVARSTLAEGRREGRLNGERLLGRWTGKIIEPVRH